MRCATHVLGVVVVAVPAPLRAAPPRSDRCPHVTHGVVIDADLRTPVEGAVVVSSTGERSTRTSSDGSFALGGLCPGEHRLTVSRPGFATTHETVTVPSRGRLELELSYAMQSVTIFAPEIDPLADLGFDDQLEGEALLRTRGLGLADALSELSGVQVLRSGAVAKPVIDGFVGNRILILNDGLRHHAQLWSLDHAPEIDPFTAHRLTVIRGAEGVRYGADGLGGVVSVSPPPYLDPTQPGVSGEANLVGIWNGRQALGNLSVVGTVPDVPRLSLRLMGSAKRAASLDAPGYPLDNTGAQDLSGAAGARYMGRGFEVSLSVSHLDQRYGIFSGLRPTGAENLRRLIERGEPPGVERYERSYDLERPFSEVEHTFVRSAAALDLGPDARLRLLYGYQRNLRDEFDVTRRPTDLPQLRFELTSHALEMTFDHTLGPELSGVAGISGLFQQNDHEGERLIPDYDRWVGGAFLIERYSKGPLTLTAGFRYERQSMDTEQPARVAPNQRPPERFSLDFEAIQASLGVRVDPIRELTLELHLASASRIPTVDELFIDGRVPGEVFFVRGDPDLSPERTFNVGLAAAFEHPMLGVELTAFIHRIDDYIYRAPRLDAEGRPGFELLVTGLTPALEYRNIEALQAGGSLEVELRPLEWLRLRSRGAWVRARNLEDGTFLVNIPPDRYENRITLAAPTLGPFSAVEVFAESVYVARQSEFDPNADFAPPPPGYHLLNAGLAGTFSVGPQEVRASLELNNLLDTSYRDYLSRLRFFADEPGWSAILRFHVPFSASFGAAPTEDES